MLGITFDGAVEGSKKCFDVSGVDRIVFDEIYLLDTFQLKRVKEYMEQHTDILFGATGDPYQLSPVGETLEVDDVKQYYINIVNSLFPNEIILKENKRCKTDEDRQIMKNLTQEIRSIDDKNEIFKICEKYGIKINDRKDQITTTKNICGTNATREWVNNLIQQKNHKENKYFVGMNLICRGNLKGKDYRTHINYTYKIVEITEKNMKLQEGLNQFELSVEMIHKHFNLPYGQTCNSAQGMSIKEGITIFDIQNWFVDKYWIYTAITRATQICDITIYRGKVDNTKAELVKQIDDMIQGHFVSDLKRDGKIGNYINTNWVLEQLKKVKTCKYCKCYLTTSGNECFSIDRLDNNLSHREDNCQIICRNCNVSKK